ncbi:hypothetical protein [Lactococcus formosensis]|jgi:hypothetical protein|uniref:hypothetical protein n=1 Tax=Lactococcus formosensis TaxID=1281486 RepID=UPI002435937B|nr:hypothetical protein [Lactococcus formosensis]MDG6113779.1 hypothetical protein [Lactococcus formosensis]MDG6122230.1 hypothetical protein [Lactococcus formosensis]MDG6151836.1 hypothetical protein [Lactococcus formosensis]MDG6174944.1 hypothetical protein [Lactococcus formosensis]MDG6181262.1 hypothetical protein [Lactococcus formosensis]
MNKINFLYACQDDMKPISILHINGGNAALNPQINIVSEMILDGDLDSYTIQILSDGNPVFERTPFPADNLKTIDTGQGTSYGLTLVCPLTVPVVYKKTSVEISFILFKDDIQVAKSNVSLFFN